MRRNGLRSSLSCGLLLVACVFAVCLPFFVLCGDAGGGAHASAAVLTC